MIGKRCASCGEDKPLSEFSRHKNGRLGRHSYCKKCFAIRSKTYRRTKLTPEKKKAHNLRSRYGLSPLDVAVMLKKQKGRCAICPVKFGRYHIDHCHTTGRVRGLLCAPCNFHLPFIEDANRLKAALEYLRPPP